MEIKTTIKIIEDNQSESILKEEVIDLWEYIEKQFQSERNPKVPGRTKGRRQWRSELHCPPRCGWPVLRPGH